MNFFAWPDDGVVLHHRSPHHPAFNLLPHALCRLGLCHAGADLDPRAVLDALGDGAPLEVALPTLGRMLRERIHRMRQGLLLRNLHRSCHLQAAADRVDVRPAGALCSSWLG